jgi:hypothetical protein
MNNSESEDLWLSATGAVVNGGRWLRSIRTLVSRISSLRLHTSTDETDPLGKSFSDPDLKTLQGDKSIGGGPIIRRCSQALHGLLGVDLVVSIELSAIIYLVALVTHDALLRCRREPTGPPELLKMLDVGREILFRELR